MPLNRRSFLWATGAAAATPALVGSPRVADAKSKKYAFRLSKLPKLKPVGGWTVVKVRKTRILFIRTSATEIKGFQGRCTHQNCMILYNGGKRRIDCGCHGSKFDLTGKVLTGPATVNLPVYPTWIKGDRLIVQVTK